MSAVTVVKAWFDPEARVWTTQSADIHGLRIEAPSLEALIERITLAIGDLLAEGEDDLEHVVPIEITAHASTRLPALVPA